jgi:hypothetical protein
MIHTFKVYNSSLALWDMPVILALRKLKQENSEFQASLGYMVRPCLKKERF